MQSDSGLAGLAAGEADAGGDGLAEYGVGAAHLPPPASAEVEGSASVTGVFDSLEFALRRHIEHQQSPSGASHPDSLSS